MKITIKSLTEKGRLGLKNYFPNTTMFKIECKITKTFVEDISDEKETVIIVSKKFSSDLKDKTYIVYLIKDLKKEHCLEAEIDYTLRADFNE